MQDFTRLLTLELIENLNYQIKNEIIRVII